ncbi:MAG TPA: DinB family protein [Dongiaceae bacterium]|nr:DinB family protein [Dongiaceae bacterium]
MPIAEMILMELEDEAKRTQRVLERIPEDKLSWRPHPKSFSLGQLGMHIAGQGNLAEVACKDVHEIPVQLQQNPPEAKSRQEVLDTFAKGIANAKEALAKKNDAFLAATWTGQVNGQTILSVPRAGFLRMVMLNHIYHHRGQLSVYLRMLNVAVPSIYGPSADENPFAATAATGR